MISSRSSRLAGEDPVGTGQDLLDLRAGPAASETMTLAAPASDRAVSCHSAPAATRSE